MLIVIAIIILIAVLLIVLSVQKRWARARYIAPRLLAAYFSVVMLLALGEAFFRFAYAESGWGFTLAYQNWEDRYWEENSLGFRDREWTSDDWQGKTTVMLLGDSFTAGWGVTNPDDRFGNVLARLLGDEYAVLNLGRPGGTPPRELAWAREHPLQNPDIIIYQYYLNDIDDAALRINDFWSPQYPLPPEWIDQESHLANFLWWRVAPWLTTINASDDESYWAWNTRTFQNSAIFDIHRDELRAVMDFAEERDARLIVVIFPNMADPVGSIPYVDAVAAVFQESGYTEILKLFDEAAGWQPSQAMVSSRDAHPSAAFHRRVGELFYEEFFAN
jgi:hypothetical protein